MPRFRRAAVVATLSLTTLAACGGGGGGTASKSAAPAETTSTTAAPTPLEFDFGLPVSITPPADNDVVDAGSLFGSEVDADAGVVS